MLYNYYYYHYHYIFPIVIKFLSSTRVRIDRLSSINGFKQISRRALDFHPIRWRRILIISQQALNII